MNWLKFITGQFQVMAPDPDPGGGGGKGDPKPTPDEPPAWAKQLMDDNKALRAELDKVKPKGDPDPKDDDLATKAAKERTEKEGKQKNEKSLESAIGFNHAGAAFVKDNAAFIPKTIEGIFAAAEKETYDSVIEKANAIKAGIVSEFFAVQSNVDFLTGAQKIQLDEFLKLTKNGKQDRVDSIYAMIFEPTLDAIKKVERAKQVGKGGKDQSDGEKALADRMMNMSKKHYLGDK